MNDFPTITTKPFDELFFHFSGSFLTVPALDINGIQVNSESFLIPEKESVLCTLCRQKFNLLFKRRTYCSICGMPFCPNCSKTQISSKSTDHHACDACATFIVSKDQADNLTGLKTWSSDNKIKYLNPKQVAIKFFSTLLFSKQNRIHRNAAVVLYRHSSSAPLFLEMNVTESLLKHSIICECDSRAITLDLFTNLYAQNTKNNFDWDLTPFNGLDPHILLRSKSALMQQVAARFLAVLTFKKDELIDTTKQNREFFDILRGGDKASVAYVLSAICSQLEIPSIQEFVGILNNSSDDSKFFEKKSYDENTFIYKKEIAQYSILQFNKTNASSSVASRFFSSKILANASMSAQSCTEIAKISIRPFGDWINVSGIESQTTFYLIFVLFNMWNWSIRQESKDQIQQNLFAMLTVSLYEVLSMEPEEDPKNISNAFQQIFLRFIILIANNPIFSDFVKNESLAALISKFKDCNTFTELATAAISSIAL